MGSLEGPDQYVEHSHYLREIGNLRARVRELEAERDEAREVARHWYGKVTDRHACPTEMLPRWLTDSKKTSEVVDKSQQNLTEKPVREAGQLRKRGRP